MTEEAPRQFDGFAEVYDARREPMLRELMAILRQGGACLLEGIKGWTERKMPFKGPPAPVIVNV